MAEGLAKEFSQLYDLLPKDSPLLDESLPLPGIRTGDNESTAIRKILTYGQKAAGVLRARGLIPLSAEKNPEEFEMFAFINALQNSQRVKVPSSGKEKELECKAPVGPLEVSFSEIAGQEQVKQELRINYIYPPQYPLLFPAIARGILLYGVVGGGKTMLAKAATAEIAKTAFFTPSPGELRGKFEGETEKFISKVFSCADDILKNEPGKYTYSIIFFDEFDSIGGKRTTESMTRSANAILQGMDGIGSSENVSVLAATNYPWRLDVGVLRRFTSRIFVDLPDSVAREYLIRSALAKVYGPPYGKTTKGIAKERVKGIFVADKFATRFDGEGVRIDYMSNITPSDLNLYATDEAISDEYIETLVEKTFAPSPLAKKFKDAVEGGTQRQIEDAENALLAEGENDKQFGYSPSDITKLMEYAIKLAGSRAMEGEAVKGLGEFKDYFIHVPVENTARAQGKLFTVAKLSPKEKQWVLNFDVRETDVEQALGEFSSTVLNKDYILLYKYSKGKYTPDEME
jgi:SpoVK/Ycf46/Vps4 family AAA+-type ATPase